MAVAAGDVVGGGGEEVHHNRCPILARSARMSQKRSVQSTGAICDMTLPTPTVLAQDRWERFRPNTRVSVHNPELLAPHTRLGVATLAERPLDPSAPHAAIDC